MRLYFFILEFRLYKLKENSMINYFLLFIVDLGYFLFFHGVIIH